MCLFTPLSGTGPFKCLVFLCILYMAEQQEGVWRSWDTKIKKRGNGYEGLLHFCLSCYFTKIDKVKMRRAAQEIWSESTVQCSNWKADKY